MTMSVAERPLVTALINTFNYARYLPFAINSVLAQTYDNIEIIIVDDGSFDHTAEVLEPYKDKVRVIVTENGGQGHAFNVGIAAAKGELIMLLDADDIWLPTKVERMVALAADHPEAGMLYHRYCNVDLQGIVNPEPAPHWMINGDFSGKFRRGGGHYWHPITSVQVLRAAHARRVLPIPTYAVREGADSIFNDCSMLLTTIASTSGILSHRLIHSSNLYASGRNELTRSRQTREGDVRRIEWRLFYVGLIMKRLGVPFEVDVRRNEWWQTNNYLLGRGSLPGLIRALFLSPENLSPRQVWARLKVIWWLRMLEKAESRGVKIDQLLAKSD
jgi:glycosyltransferase involved in cell wall biosynthesis